jgi:hypothetical protein
MPSKYTKHLRHLKRVKKPVLFRVTNRLIYFLFSFSLVIYIFYIAGNYQQFLDKTQKLILTVLSYTSIILIWFCICAIAEVFVYSFKLKTTYFMRFIIIYVLIAIISFINAFAGTFITFISH